MYVGVLSANLQFEVLREWRSGCLENGFTVTGWKMVSLLHEVVRTGGVRPVMLTGFSKASGENKSSYTEDNELTFKLSACEESDMWGSCKVAVALEKLVVC